MKIQKLVQYTRSLCCPYCNSVSFIRRGKVKGIQRYLCKGCNRSFRDTSLTPMHHLHKKELVEKYLDAMEKGMSVRKSAEYVGVSKNTSFNWRHKLISSMRACPVSKCQKQVGGASIIRLPYSEKGRKKASVDPHIPSKSILVVTAKQLWLTTISHKNSVTELSQKIDKQFNNCFLSKMPDKLLTEALKKQTAALPINNIQSRIDCEKLVMNQQNKLMTWMMRFRGVATKYLLNYWSWYSAIQNAVKYCNSHSEFIQQSVSQRNLLCYRILKVR